MSAGHPFLIGVSLYDSTLVSYDFDQDRVVVGRGDDVDLQLAHAAVARRQLTIERIIPPIGQPRFRIVPHEPSRNPVLLNGAPAVAEAIGYGDVVAVGETRLVLLPPPKPKKRRSPLVIAAAVGAVLLAAGGAVTLLDGPASEPAAPVANEKLFAHLPTVSCADARQCSERARLAYAHGRTYAKDGATVPGNWYRAALEFYRAAEFMRLGGAPVAGLEDTRDRLAVAAGDADTLFNDLQFRLARELKGDDVAALHHTLDALEALVPDEEHPIRLRIAEYRRAHPLPKKGSAK
jgi:hypothetical protein